MSTTNGSPEVHELLKETRTVKKALDDLGPTLKEAAPVLKKFKEAMDKPDYKGADIGKLFAEPRDAKEPGRCGFKSMSHQLRAIMADRRGDISTDDSKRLKSVETYIKAATGLGEASGPDGGYLLAPTFVEGVMEIVHQSENLLDRCDKYDMAGPSMVFRAIDETSRATGSRRGGVRGYWVDEGATITASKPKFRSISIVPHKLAVLSYMTEELMQDSGSMIEQYVSRSAAEELNFLVSNSIINGTGVGQPLGILNAACLVSVAKETGQSAATIVTENIVKMWARMHSSARQNAVWFYNQDCEPQLHLMTLGVGTGGVVTYMPPGGLSERPYATLLGRPMLPIEFCPTLGTVGDIILADMKQFIAATRGSMQAASSIHVNFLQDEMAFRLTFRVAGMPWWNSALTPLNGTATQSPFVALATRA